MVTDFTMRQTARGAFPLDSPVLSYLSNEDARLVLFFLAHAPEPTGFVHVGFNFTNDAFRCTWGDAPEDGAEAETPSFALLFAARKWAASSPTPLPPALDSAHTSAGPTL